MMEMWRRETVLKYICTWYIFQEETGENGTKHLQGTATWRSERGCLN